MRRIMTDEFYLSSRWKKKREIILKRDGYIDQVAKRYGKIKEATIVHHIFPRREFPEYEMENWNLISVSFKTHQSLHDIMSENLTKEGRALLERTARKQGISV